VPPDFFFFFFAGQDEAFPRASDRDPLVADGGLVLFELFLFFPQKRQAPAGTAVRHFFLPFLVSLFEGMRPLAANVVPQLAFFRFSFFLAIAWPRRTFSRRARELAPFPLSRLFQR